MPRTLIWDLPVRLFHWLFAVGFATAALIALATDDEGALFPYHAAIGLIMVVLVVLRAAWALIGSRHARIGSFLVGPASVAKHLRTVASARATPAAGRNPAGAYAALAMAALLLGLAATGIMLGRGNESVKDIHEVMAWTFVGVVGAHLLGLLLHTLLRRENIARSMIDGRALVDPRHGIRSGHPLAAAALLACTGLWTVVVLRGYNRDTRTITLPIAGELHLGEDGHHDNGKVRSRHSD